MSKLTFEPETTVKVKLDGKFIGTVKEVKGGYAYYPKGCSAKFRGNTFASLKACMKSLA